jgi:hypothetical protein
VSLGPKTNASKAIKTPQTSTADDNLYIYDKSMESRLKKIYAHFGDGDWSMENTTLMLEDLALIN